MVTAPRSSLCRVLLSAASNRDSRSHSITGTCYSQHKVILEAVHVMECLQGALLLAQHGLLCLRAASLLQKVFIGSVQHDATH